MTKLALALAASLLSAAAFAASPAATRDWVRQYVATNGAYKTTITQTVSTNDAVARISYTNDDGRVISMTMNMHDKLALGVTNCTAAAFALGVTNGTLFAWNGSNSFENAALGLSILTSGTNGLSFAGVTSHTNETHDVIDGYFWLYGVRIDRPTARELLGAPLAASTRFADAPTRFVGALADAFARFVGEILVPSAAADTWGDIPGWDYTPKYKSYGTDYSWLVQDDQGNVGVVQYDEDGIPTQASMERVISDLRLNIGSLFKNCANLASAIINHDKMLQELDMDLTFLDERLDSAFAEIFGKLKDLETDESSPDGSGIEKTRYEIIDRSETKIVLKGGVAAAYVDNASISLNKKDAKNPKYQLYGFDDELTKILQIPYKATGHLSWNEIGYFADGVTLQRYYVNQEPSFGYAPVLGLVGWTTPTESPNDCDESLATQLATPKTEGAGETHYVLTKHIQDGQLHYTPVGHFTGGATTDETTITTNGAVKGELQIKGSETAGDILVSASGETAAPQWTTPQAVTVITGITGELGADGKLKLTLTKKSVKVVGTPEAVDPEDVELLTAPEQEVVVYTEYDDSEHEFYDHVKTVRVIESSEASPTRRNVPTFTATELQQ